MIAHAAPHDTRRSFQQLKTRVHRQIVDAIDLSRASQLDESDMRDQLRALAAHLCARQDTSLDEQQQSGLVGEIMDEIYGFGPLQPLMDDPEVTDILVNGPARVLVERRGLLEPTEIQFADDAHLLQFIQRLVGRGGRRIDESSPTVDVKLPDGSRLNAVIPPLALRGPTVSIRRFGHRRLGIEDMVELGTLAPEMADFLIMAVRSRTNILFSGGTGAGKTTMLNSVSRYVPARERVVTIEETAELQLQQLDVVGLETRMPNIEGQGGIGQRELIRNALRMRPDRIIVGEARGGEVLDMLQAMNTGHDGSMSTVHANDTRDALDRLELMIALSGVELSTQVARQYIANALHYVVHITRLSTGQRKITRISEVSGFRDGDYVFEDIFVYRVPAGTEPEAGTYFATGYEPKAIRRVVGKGIAPERYRALFSPRELATECDYTPL